MAIFFLWIRSFQNGSNLIKLDFHQTKIVAIKNCHIYHEDKMVILFLIFLDQIRPKWIKLEQIEFLTNQKCYFKKWSHLP